MPGTSTRRRPAPRPRRCRISPRGCWRSWPAVASPRVCRAPPPSRPRERTCGQLLVQRIDGLLQLAAALPVVRHDHCEGFALPASSLPQKLAGSPFTVLGPSTPPAAPAPHLQVGDALDPPTGPAPTRSRTRRRTCELYLELAEDARTMSSDATASSKALANLRASSSF